MKLKYMLKKAVNLKTGYLIAIVLVLMLVIGGYFSYALFTATSEAKGALNIVTGNLYSLIESTDLDENKSISIKPNDRKIIIIKLTNTNGRKAKVNLYYEATSNDLEIGYLKSGDKAPGREGYVLDESGTAGSTKTIKIKIANNDDAVNKITFGSSVGLENAILEFPQDKKNIEFMDGINYNDNIILAYTYDQANEETKCITGEEPTCVLTNCYENDNPNSCPVGTIIKYKVDDEHDYYFNLISDLGDTMTMQARNPIGIRGDWVAAAGGNTNTNGPIVAINNLDKATENWKNVNDQEYQMGTTIFGDNAFTGCGDDLVCKTNTYVMDKHTSKARMITVQEAVALGCTNQVQQCPIFMYNYTYDCVKNGCTINDDSISEEGSYYNYGTFTMNAYSYNASQAWYIANTGLLAKTELYKENSNIGYDVRPLVVINKN